MPRTFKSLVFLSVLLLPRLASAEGYWTGTFDEFQKSCDKYHEPDYQKNIRYSTSTFLVIKGTETFTLHEFITSGRFCDAYGHIWIKAHPGYSLSYDPCSEKCKLCDRCRKRRKVNRQVEEFEP